MSWRNARVYNCSICGDYYVQYKSDYGIFVLPYRWTGSRRKHGECYCEKCTKALLKIRDKMETIKEENNG